LHCKGMRRRASDPCRCPGYDDGFRHDRLLFAGGRLRQRTDNTGPC
jgi:hypothetical protein